MGGTETLFLLFARAARATRYLRKQKRQQHKHFRIKNGLVEYVDENIWYDQSYETSYTVLSQILSICFPAFYNMN